MSRMLQSIYYVRNKCACLNVSSKDRSWSFRCEIMWSISLHSERPSGAVRASSLFPILSVGLLFLGGVCVAASEFYKSRYNVILCAGILFVSAGQKLTHTHTRLLPQHPQYSAWIWPSPFLQQVSATLLASLCTYQPTRVTPARATTRRVTHMAGPFTSELCPLCWPRWWACWQCTCS